MRSGFRHELIAHKSLREHLSGHRSDLQILRRQQRMKKFIREIDMVEAMRHWRLEHEKGKGSAKSWNW